MLYGPTVWDPVLIIAQITAIQCIFYITLGLLQTALVAPYTPRLALFHMFDWRWVSFRSFQGWMVVTAFGCNAFATAVAIRLIVKRAKKCLDFSATVFFVHLIATACFSGFPAHIVWWTCMAVDMGVVAVLSEWLCLQEELKEIPLASIPRRRIGGSSTELTSIATQR